MPKVTEQIQSWAGSFGREYTDRNALSLEEMEAMYQSRYGLTRTELNARFLARVDRSARILEVGSNIGNQLLCLERMGFRHVYGVEVQGYAAKLSKSRGEHLKVIEGSAFDIPYQSGYFDLVFTSGVLIHLHPSDVAAAMREIHRCTRCYIWGFEYYADEYTEISYRSRQELLWKANFGKLYLDIFDDLQIVQEERLQYRDSENVDSMFLLRKKM
jgi:pseudaminic acid biosynthesis-associated methylase